MIGLSRHWMRIALGLAASSPIASAPTFAQSSYPNQPIRFVVPKPLPRTKM